MKRMFFPDYFFENIYLVTPEFLLSRGISVLVLDIDNTLVTYDDPAPTEDVIRWVERMKSAGIKTAIASNNHGERVDRFNSELGTFAVCDSKKPSRRAIRTVCAHFEEKPSGVALIGDQIFTDVLCAKRSGATALLVRPLPYDENLFFRFKRFLERPIIKKFKKKNPDKCFEKGADAK